MSRFTYRFFLSILFLLPFFSSAGQWRQDRFMIGTFMDPSPEVKDFRSDSIRFDYQISMVKNAYFNFLSGYTSYGNNTLDYLTFKLEVLSHYQMYTMYNISSGYTGTNLVSTIQYTKSLAPDLRQWFLGYFLYDEPQPENVYQMRYLVSRVKILDNTHLAYINLFPAYWFNSRTQYEGYLDSMLVPDPAVSTDMVSYDFYPFPDQGFKADYYYNLATIRQKAGQRPFWFYVLTTPFGPYSDPTLYQMSFMTFNPLCYGAKGYLVFTYSPPPYDKNYRYQFGNGILARDGAPTPKLNDMGIINHFVQDIVGPVVMKSSLLGTYHVSNQPYHQSIPDSAYIQEDMPLLSRIGNENMLAGIFQDTLSPTDYYVFFVNKSPLAQQNVFITFKGNYEDKITVSPSYLDYQTGDEKFEKLKASYDPQANETHVFLDFVPGEGRMVRVTPVDNPFQHVYEPDHFSYQVAPNPFRGSCSVNFSLTRAADVRLSIYSLDGRLQQQVINPTHFLAGKYYETLIPNFRTPGIYMLELRIADKSYGKKIIFLGH